MGKTIIMSRQYVGVGTKFSMALKFGHSNYYFGFEHGRSLVVRRKGGQYIGDVTDITDEGFELTVWILGKKASAFIRYDEIIYAAIHDNN